MHECLFAKCKQLFANFQAFAIHVYDMHMVYDMFSSDAVCEIVLNDNSTIKVFKTKCRIKSNITGSVKYCILPQNGPQAMNWDLGKSGGWVFM